MKCFSLLIGSNNQRGRFDRRDESLLQEITARYFPAGFSILAAKGAWYDPEVRRFRKEESREVLICTAEVKKLEPWCRELGRALRQKELVLIESGRAQRFRISSSEPRETSPHRNGHSLKNSKKKTARR